MQDYTKPVLVKSLGMNGERDTYHQARRRRNVTSAKLLRYVGLQSLKDLTSSCSSVYWHLGIFFHQNIQLGDYLRRRGGVIQGSQYSDGRRGKEDRI